MVAVVGTFQNGYVKLDKEYSTDKPVKVIITFLEEIQSQRMKAYRCLIFPFQKVKKTWKITRALSVMQ